jgi:hypothetical protein
MSKRRTRVHAAVGSRSWEGKSVSVSWYLFDAMTSCKSECNSLINWLRTGVLPIFWYRPDRWFGGLMVKLLVSQGSVSSHLSGKRLDGEGAR